MGLSGAQSPFAQSGCYPSCRDISASSAGVTPPSSLLRAHAPILHPLPASVCKPCAASLCRSLSAPAGKRTFPALSLRIFLDVLEPLPRLLPWCIYPFLPTGQRPSRRSDSVGAWQYPHSNFRAALVSRLQLVVNLPARRFARPPCCSYRSAFRHQADRASTSPPISVCYLAEQEIC
jgi:hypothetical protein